MRLPWQLQAVSSYGFALKHHRPAASFFEHYVKKFYGDTNSEFLFKVENDHFDLGGNSFSLSQF